MGNWFMTGQPGKDCIRKVSNVSVLRAGADGRAGDLRLTLVSGPIF